MVMAIAKADNNKPIFGPYLNTAKAIDTDAATWILGKE